jgi:hypothetical protein
MSEASAPKMEFDVVAVRLSAHASEARCKQVWNSAAKPGKAATWLRVEIGKVKLFS